MSDDYLWDGTGTPRHDDADVVKLEQMLGQLRAPLPRLPDMVGANPSVSSTLPALQALQALPALSARASARFLAPALVLAASVVLMLAVTYRTSVTPPAAWEVAQVDGDPRIEGAQSSAPLIGLGRLAVGETLTTDADSRARIDVSTIGQVTVDPDTRVRLVATREGHHELALARGTLHAVISAPPGQFIVNTPSSKATDLGCVYSLTVDEDGTGLLSVTAGWVAFEFNNVESFVPGGASARTDPRFGPGTPRYDDAAFVDALDRFDRGVDRRFALPFVLEHARQKDAMTLWHLLARTTDTERPAVIDALERIVPMPIGVTRDAVQHLDRATLDLWWNALGLDDASWWRMWKRSVPQ